MFLLVSVRHVGAHTSGQQHGVSIRISINLGKTFLRISRIRNILLTWILARVFVYLPPFISQISDFIYWTVLIFILIYFEWRDTENQQFTSRKMFRLLQMYVNRAGHILTVSATRQAIRAKIGLKLRKHAKRTAATSSLCGIKKKTSIFSIGWMVPRAGLG